MMHGREKSDSAIVAEKPANKAGQPAAESVERRAGAEGNAGQQSTRRAQNRESVSQALDRIRQAARQRKKERFTALLHHISVDHLEAAFFALKRKCRTRRGRADMAELRGGPRSQARGPALRGSIGSVSGAAVPATVYIPKADGRQRPLAVAALEDKIVQRATVAVLNAIYEEDFLGFSYGFRPKRGQHDALDALVVGITSTR